MGSVGIQVHLISVPQLMSTIIIIISYVFIIVSNPSSLGPSPEQLLSPVTDKVYGTSEEVRHVTVKGGPDEGTGHVVPGRTTEK